jgi:hypothetical protein
MSYLDMTQNMRGHLTGKARDRLVAVLANPTQETWQDACVLILNRDGFKTLTLWQAVIAVDPTFPTSKPSGKPWSRVPDYDLIARAIRYAVTREIS